MSSPTGTAHPRSRGENGGLPVLHPSMTVAHPRSRGENRAVRRGLATPRGSSPLTRGKLHRLCRHALHLGLIPAHAGKTGAFARACLAAEAHPRSRGENCRRLRNVRLHGGSSPLTRGKLGVFVGVSQSVGLIPAHAGKTGRSGGRAPDEWAHPRSRGENRLDPITAASVEGSSPLTRGKPPPLRGRIRRRRLIPAHAGKTGGGSPSLDMREAHPRSRGENAGM